MNSSYPHKGRLRLLERLLAVFDLGVQEGELRLLCSDNKQVIILHVGLR